MKNQRVSGFLNCASLFKICFKGCLGGSVKRPAMDFSSGHDLVVFEFEPRVGLHADSAEPVQDSLSLSLCLSSPHPTRTHALFLYQSK